MKAVSPKWCSRIKISSRTVKPIKILTVVTLLILNSSTMFSANSGAGTGAGIFSWSNPLMFLLLFIAGFILYAMQILIRTHKYLAEVGSEPKYEVFSGLLKWSTTHQKSVAVIMIIIILSAIAYAM